MTKFKAIVMGVSAGGLKALKTILPALPKNFSLPIIIVQHLAAQSDNIWIDILGTSILLKIKEADEKEKIENGTIYIAPAAYHLLIEKDCTFSLLVDERVNYAIPSIDVLFESAADAYGDTLIGVILTGANNDGALGLKKIKDMGGVAIVQDPLTADASYMPAAAIATVNPDYITPLQNITDLLIALDKTNLTVSL
jgi:two-component system chemotaxis response regulator CheB